MIKIVSIVGARPQFIKAAVLSRLLRKTCDVHEILVHTGQHYDKNMSQVFFDTMDIPSPDYNLGITEKSHGAQTGRMLEEIEKVLLCEKPGCVLVYGDTNSTLAGALAASKLHIRLAHVEAGLRSFNKHMPEEINRVLTDHVSDILFTPSQSAELNLIHEGISREKIKPVGDVMYDATLYYIEKSATHSQIINEQQLSHTKYVLATIHRAENTDDPSRLKSIFNGFLRLSKEMLFVIPLHPRTKNALSRIGLLESVSASLRLIDPVNYLDMVQLEKNASLIVTDSGGVQKEAYFHRVPCVTLRRETEWIELTQSGCNHLINPVSSIVVEQGIRGFLDVSHCVFHGDLYGNGDASNRIVEFLSKLKEEFDS